MVLANIVRETEFFCENRFRDLFVFLQWFRRGGIPDTRKPFEKLKLDVPR